MLTRSLRGSNPATSAVTGQRSSTGELLPAPTHSHSLGLQKTVQVKVKVQVQRKSVASGYPRRIFYRGKARRLLIDLRGVDRTFPEVND